jgi:hypothetical protein
MLHTLTAAWKLFTHTRVVVAMVEDLPTLNALDRVPAHWSRAAQHAPLGTRALHTLTYLIDRYTTATKHSSCLRMWVPNAEPLALDFSTHLEGKTVSRQQPLGPLSSVAAVVAAQ